MTTHSTEQLALFMNARDVRDYGTAAWADLDLAGKEAYLTDSAAFVSAMKALGWTPPAEDDPLATPLEVPEPSAEEPECFAEKPDWPDHWTTNDKLRDLHARWHEQKGNLIGREECGYERCEFWDAAEFTLRLADVRIAGRDTQGEPSDAPVLAALFAYNRSRSSMVYTEADEAGMRAALRAASAVTEQGENR